MNNPDGPALSNDQDLKLDRYAEVLAHTLHFRTAPRGEVLARLGVPENRWIEASAKWTQFLVQEAAEDDAPAARKFGAAFAVARTRLRAECPTLESLGPLPVEEAPDVAEAVLPAAAAIAPSLPIAERAPPAVLAIDASSPPAFASGESSPWARSAVPTFTVGERSLAEPPVLMAPYAPEPDTSWVPEGMRRFTSVDTTQAAGGAPSAPVLPFARDAEARDAALENAILEAARIQGPNPGRPTVEEVGATLALTGLRARVAAAALPFPSSGSTAGVDPHLTPSGAAKGRGPDATMALSGLRSLAQAPDASLALASGSVPVPVLSLERFASVWVELSFDPERRAEILWRYELTDQQWTAVEREWQARFTREPPARTAWEHACTEYRNWLVKFRR